MSDLEKKVDEFLLRGVDQIVDKENLKKDLLSGKVLKVKFGIDPTSPNIHIGRAVVLWKLRALQDLGHEVLFIIGNFTGTIGDTSDKESERPMLDDEVVAANMKEYWSQASKILIKEQTSVVYNADWLSKLTLSDIGYMADAFSVHDFISRELVKKRLDEGKRVSLREMLYPLMQGYDSVHLQNDIELGGSDQWFNLLAGRTLQPLYNQKPQYVLTMKLISGTDGRKMSSSWGNVVNLTDSSKEMFGKIMSMPDEVMMEYFISCTRISMEKIESIENDIPHPRDRKLFLAESIVSLYFDEDIAKQERESFLNQFSKGELPEDIISLDLGSRDLIDLLIEKQLVVSKSELRRLIDQGGVKVNDEVIADYDKLELRGGENLIQIGKRKFLKINK